MKPVCWHGTSLEAIRGFPLEACQDAGFQLDKVQRGLEPDDWKPMPSIGPGVREIRIREASGAYRVIYLATFADAVHVLHCFQKKTQKTAKKDIDIARMRLREVL